MQDNESHDRPSETVPSESQTVGDATPAELSLHNNFVAASRQLQRGLARTLYYLLAIHEAKVYRTFGFATIEKYAKHHVGLSSRTVREMLTLARRMRSHRSLAEAVEDGGLPWRKALLISREVVEEGRGGLIATARDLTRNELKQVLGQTTIPAPVNRASMGGPSRREPFDRTDPTPKRPAPERDSRSVAAADPPSRDTQYVTLKMSPEQYARWESATAGPQNTVETVLTSLAGTGRDAPPFRLILLHCPACERTEVVTGRGDLEVPASLLDRARCDAQVEDENQHRRLTVAPRVRRAVMRRARYRCEAQGCRHTRWLEVHHRVPVSHGGTDELENLAVLCSACHRRLHEREDALRRTVRDEPR